jgi:hypothetical protein
MLHYDLAKKISKMTIYLTSTVQRVIVPFAIEAGIGHMHIYEASLSLLRVRTMVNGTVKAYIHPHICDIKQC